MRYLITIIVFMATVATASAQQLTAGELISKIHCKDTTCYQALFASKGYMAMPSYFKAARVVNYTQKAKDCTDAKGGDNHAMLSVESWPKGYAFKITTMCVDTYDKLMGEFTAEGFTADIHTTSSPSGGEIIKTAKYTSAKHKNMVLYAGKGDKNGKSFCIVRLMAE